MRTARHQGNLNVRAVYSPSFSKLGWYVKGRTAREAARCLYRYLELASRLTPVISNVYVSDMAVSTPTAFHQRDFPTCVCVQMTIPTNLREERCTVWT